MSSCDFESICGKSCARDSLTHMYHELAKAEQDRTQLEREMANRVRRQTTSALVSRQSWSRRESTFLKTLQPTRPYSRLSEDVVSKSF